MKKLVFIMPLMAVSLLASCGNKPGPVVNTYTITFNCQQCKAFDKDDKEVTSITVPVVESEHTLYQEFHFEGNQPFKVPLKSNISIKKTGTDETVEYKYMNGDLFVPIVGNLTISAKGTSYDKSLENSSWDEIAEISATGRADEFFDVSDTKKVKVNEKDHDVRIIGFNQDKDKDGNEIGITFEFANLISDNQGHSLATQWDDTNDTDAANHNYLDSSVRMALVGEKQDKGHILWAQKGATAWSTKDDYKKSVLEMLPEELTKVLVAPQKTVKCYENKEWADKPIINSKGEYDELFLLSPEEMGNNATREGAYTYYQETDEEKLKLLRVKKQTLNDEAYTDVARISYVLGSGQIYRDTVDNFAGYNKSVDETEGGLSWLRSPNTSNSYCAWRVVNDGYLNGRGYVYNSAFAVAPAFCI